MTARRLAGFLFTSIGAAGFAACLAAAFSGMRDVMRAGGYCASGGPYVIAQQCSSTDIRLLTVGLLGGLLAAVIYAGGTAALGRPASAAGLLAWTALFGVLGWNFISMGQHPAAGQGAVTGWLVTGGVFWLMALGGLLVLLGIVISDLRNAGRPDPVITGLQPLVMAAGLPGVPLPPSGGAGGCSPAGWSPAGWSPAGWQASGVPMPGRVPQPPVWQGGSLSAWLWLSASLEGAVLGVLASSALITLLR